ncbi:MAG: acyloxyacyl hydrolase [Terriglobales bacterium]
MLQKIMDRSMNVIGRFRSALAFLFLLSVARPLHAQSEADRRNWDLAVWAAGETGEENTNSFAEAQILTAGVFIGKELTDEIGSGWRRGRLEFGISVIPLFRQFRAETIYGGGFEPVILRWNSSLHTSHLAPYIELAGGAVRTNTNFPTGDTSDFNFTARGGGGIQVFTKRRQFVDIGCRWSHISNANLGTRNPEFNGIQVSVGYHWIR